MPSHNPHGPHPGAQPGHEPGAVPQPGGHGQHAPQYAQPQPMQPHHQPQYTHFGQPQPVQQNAQQPQHSNHSPQPEAQPQQDYSQPVAYDVHGRPLYLHPQQAQPMQQPQTPQQPQMVYLARPLEPEDPHISEEVQARHEDSRKKFPHLNLSAGEYVLIAVKRHPVGILRIWAVVAVLMILFSAMAAMFLFSPTMDSEGTKTMLTVGLILVYLIIILGALAATYIYEANRFYMTNESVIQEIQTSLFDKREQTVSLGNIEDASYRQTSFVQTFLNYGSIRLSTEGDETTYRFDYVAQPKKHIATLNNAVESFKNGRPVE